MTFREYLYKKADEAGHNEILAYLTMILGAIFLVGGLLVTIIVAENLSWFLLPYQPSPHPSSILGLLLTVPGFTLVSAGFILVIHYDRKRSWLMKELKKSSLEERKLRRKSVSELLRKYG